MGKETPRVNKEGTIFSQFARYVSLNVLSMAGLSCYILADTYFISAGVGSNGIAALNLALPAYSLLNGIGLMVGMGGATRYSILRGEGREDEANQVFTHAAGMAALLGILFTAAGLLFSWENRRGPGSLRTGAGACQHLPEDSPHLLPCCFYLTTCWSALSATTDSLTFPWPPCWWAA